ncbi:MAG: hypothetical protein LBE08_11755 [Bifidobacteriaceae bacterium]|nr:hypothetical protein [Bifidobacteriaceae bacterium]
MGTRRFAVGSCLIVVVAAELAVGLASMSYPPDGEPTMSRMLPGLANNAAVGAFLAVALIGVLGRLAGSLATCAVLYLMWWAVTASPAVGSLLPVTLQSSADLSLDLSPRPIWLALLLAFCLVLAWARRLVPLGFGVAKRFSG